MPESFDELLRHAIATVGASALALPEAYEEDAWIGVRWRIRQRTFAHVAPVDGRSPAFERAAGGPGPYVVMTFRSDGEELDTLTRIGHPYFKPAWSPTVVGVHLRSDTDWGEIAELVTESYCLLAPKKLATLVDRPGITATPRQ
jgi:hypothetical protein